MEKKQLCAVGNGLCLCHTLLRVNAADRGCQQLQNQRKESIPFAPHKLLINQKALRSPSFIDFSPYSNLSMYFSSPGYPSTAEAKKNIWKGTEPRRAQRQLPRDTVVPSAIPWLSQSIIVLRVMSTEALAIPLLSAARIGAVPHHIQRLQPLGSFFPKRINASVQLRSPPWQGMEQLCMQPCVPCQKEGQNKSNCWFL